MHTVPKPMLGLLVVACGPAVEPPSAEELEACEDQSIGDSGFDWSCCDVWAQECRANRDGGCEWICNG